MHFFFIVCVAAQQFSVNKPEDSSSERHHFFSLSLSLLSESKTLSHRRPNILQWVGMGWGVGDMEKRMMYRSNLEFGSIVLIK